MVFRVPHTSPTLRIFIEKGMVSPLVGFNPTIFIQLGAALLLVGLGFKVALVPFHGWAPDVYDGSLHRSFRFCFQQGSRPRLLVFSLGSLRKFLGCLVLGLSGFLY